MAQHPNSRGAAAAAHAIQQALSQAAAAVPEDRRMRFRIGVHLGDYRPFNRPEHMAMLLDSLRKAGLSETGVAASPRP